MTTIEDIKNLRNQALSGGGSANVTRHRERGKLFVRDRISQLIDSGSYFLEIGMLAGNNLYEGTPPGAGIVCGIGIVSGRPCMIVANDATVKGGTYFPMTVKKHLRAQEIAVENRLPCIYLVDSGGAFLPLQDEVFPDRDHFGRIFFNQANLSAKGIPQLSVVMGSCTAGGAYVPAMSDEAIIVENQGTIFLGGPPLVKAATGEIVSAEDLGGGRVHSTISGVTDHLASNDEEALTKARRIVKDLFVSSRRNVDRALPEPPRYDTTEIQALIPKDHKSHFPMREILLRIVDGSEFEEFKSNYGATIICGFARIEGYLVGILANDGILFSESSLKATHFIELCNQRGIPLVFFQNIVGFMVGKEFEHRGIAKDGAKLVNAVACSKVPKYTVIVGNSFGAGNYGMCGRAYQPRFLWAWPNSRTAVMGPEQAASVLTQVKTDGATAKGKRIPEKEIQAYHKEISDKYTQQADSLYGTARLWDDGIILPHETRSVLGIALSLCEEEDLEVNTRYGVFRT